MQLLLSCTGKDMLSFLFHHPHSYSIILIPIPLSPFLFHYPYSYSIILIPIPSSSFLFHYPRSYSIIPILIPLSPFLFYSFLVSLFFTNANMAACVAAVVYFLFFFVQIVILNKLSLLPVGAVMLMVCYYY